MLFTTRSVIVFMLAGTRVILAATQPACVQDCISENPTSSWCDGDETGDDLAECTCQSIYGSLMLQCIQKCPEADQATYASGLPGTCGETLFPDIDIPETTSTLSSSAAASTPTRTNTDSGARETETPASDGNDSGTGAAAGLIIPTWMLGASILGLGVIGL
ncbi:hypothetical protein F5B22DRAFT_653593 [Xylaria bambusicola]|uniref:uncharacterized protein n=1 Tax=Xylaria bambusicola TaxID=326684 RepID=UPI0020075B1A|nr:uncharacterized protein F5B22DRAFT_653593 [Xylaria bambusicola]KAI0502806.1 hypothetical protein F5B22DRAFT_653593 [Xylaria bambusicola]